MGKEDIDGLQSESSVGDARDVLQVVVVVVIVVFFSAVVMGSQMVRWSLC